MPDQQTFAFCDFTLSVVVTPPPWYVNCCIVRHGPSGEQVVVDPGGNAEAVAARVAANGAGPVRILLTHGHPDHLGAVRDLQQRLGGATCLAHAAERPVVENAGAFSRALMGVHIPPPDPVEYFDGEPDLPFGGARIRVIHTPGHTPGGVCYDFGGFVLTGDTLFDHGFGRTDLPGGEGRLLMASIDRLLGLLADETVLFAGHGGDWTAAEARDWWAMMRGGL